MSCAPERSRQLAALLGAVILALALCPSAARADADPASDYLLLQPVFYPYAPPTSAALQRALGQAVSRLKARGIDLKVAIIAGPGDLGAVANVFGHPQQYATFLDQEISFNKRQALLVVMPGGYGTAHAGPPTALAGLPVDAGHGADGLARSALTAVVRLAAAMGRPIATPVVPSVGAGSGGSGGSLPGWVAFAAPALAVLAAAALSAAIGRRRHRRADADAD